MERFNNEKDFLASMVTEGTVTVPTEDLRNLLIIKRELARKLNKVKKQNDLLWSRNTSLKEEVELLKLKSINDKLDCIKSNYAIDTLA